MTIELDDELCNTSRMHIHVLSSTNATTKGKKRTFADESRYSMRDSLRR